jgi:hypothetical protein
MRRHSRIVWQTFRVLTSDPVTFSRTHFTLSNGSAETGVGLVGAAVAEDKARTIAV